MAGDTARPATANTAATPAPMTSDMLAGHRLITLLFDVSSMQPEDVQRAVDSARKYVDEQMSTADLVAVAYDRFEPLGADRLHRRPGDGRRGARRRSPTPTGPRPRPPAPAPLPPTKRPRQRRRHDSGDAAELDMFNNDVRLRALKTLAEAMSPIEQKKSILYFSAGMQRSGQDNQVELRSAINAAVRRTSPSMPWTRAGCRRSCRAATRGRPAAAGTRALLRPRRAAAVRAARLVAGHADVARRRHRRPRFTDSNDFGEAFARVQRDMSAYYLLGYSSTNPVKDGRFRRIQVRVKNERLQGRGPGRLLRGSRLHPHVTRRIAKRSSHEQLFAAVSATDLPVMVSGGWFRLARGPILRADLR